MKMREFFSLCTMIILVLISTSSWPRVTGHCALCHTMHNSQNNVFVTDNGKPNPALLITSCIGCHTGHNDGSNTTPYVYSTNPPQYRSTGTEAGSNTLAGGSFYWVGSVGDRRGHNIVGLTARDQTLSMPPGGTGTFNAQLKCAGTSGCHGNRSITEEIQSVKGSHHSKDHSVWQDGSSLFSSYRMLDGIQGLGDPEYEYHPRDARHNKYYGEDRSSETETADGTISSHCASCHEYYHQGPATLVPSTSFNSGVWLRHPVDFDMSKADSSTEFQFYNNSATFGNNIYSVIAPVATSDKSDTINTTVYNRANDAVVMCLSCHRAHGSPNGAGLRWNYKTWPAAGFNGCAICHTAKD